MLALKKFFLAIWKLINDYPAVFSAIAIYAYYLITSIDYFRHTGEKKTLLDHVLQFDSLIWMWIAAAALLQLQKYRKRQREEVEQRQMFQHEINLQQVQNDLLNDITAVLQDSINNPLAIISLKTQEMRRRFGRDPNVTRLLKSIEGAIKRIEHTVRDLKGYVTQKIMKASADRVSKKRSSTS